MLNPRTNASGPIAVRGEIVEIAGMVCKTTLARKTIFDNLVNCRISDLGRKVRRLYLLVLILFPGKMLLGLFSP